MSTNIFYFDESSIEEIGSSSVDQNKGDKVAVTDEQVQNNENVATVAAEKPTSSNVTTSTTCMESSISKNVGNICQGKRISPEDMTQMQYAVLVEQRRKLQMQTTFYMLMNKKLRRDLEMPSED